MEELHLPYMYTQGDRAFHDAAEAYGDASRRPWIQITEDADPEMLICPLPTSWLGRRIFDVVDGRLARKCLIGGISIVGSERS
ncbi:hypothetical protein BN77_p2170002 [Rhizobium mesoamericanum STM3625]|uniref:Uncharacterized protein n=1 Tax=Rhizobium mesoamericanum STM3625 TaxID=1211777 RepID=K0Q4L0_9HYPH|nr:hypothetical protein BN77_p2170002 [Rhizobium mesoamericanum STM3625]